MSVYLVLKTLHILSSVLLVGTGLGSAFYMFFTNRSGNVAAQAIVSRLVVRADWLFTTPCIIVQPLTGWAMMHIAGWPISTPWIAASLMLYVLAGICWLPVVWLQIRMAAVAAKASAENKALPPLYEKYQFYWEILGYPAFIATFIIYFLMVLKPVLW